MTALNSLAKTLSVASLASLLQDITMHNVKKTPASDAQLAARVKERDLKLQIYVELRNLIFDKRGKSR